MTTDKIVKEVIHYENEKLVAMVMDYKVAACVMWLLGNVLAKDRYTNTLFDALGDVNDIYKHYEDLSTSCTLERPHSGHDFVTAYGEK